MNILHRFLLNTLLPGVERTVNDPGLKCELGIPDGISFKVSIVEDAKSNLDKMPVKVTAVGDGFTAEQLYDAEWKMEAKFKNDLPGTKSERIMDH